MKKRTKRLLGFVALTAAVAGGVSAFFIGRKRMVKKKNNKLPNKGVSVWARPGMRVTFRAELMPGKDKETRTFRVKELLSSGRVTLHEFAGEHAEQEFEPIR